MHKTVVSAVIDLLSILVKRESVSVKCGQGETIGTVNNRNIALDIIAVLEKHGAMPSDIADRYRDQIAELRKKEQLNAN